ncbi:hypothetical protein RND71_020714 [Anisodus tanguticus]|uniref:Uncharacterized protein n=1 Tax=Anisodus tanguticus TaxID=243964 RepID=A0AAE1RVN1_9SOLA|nr:hypothetical protein RND71_020714 [Anisodus tanguticus]
MEAQTVDFCAGDLEALSAELKVSKNVRKLYAGMAKLEYISSTSEPINIEAFSHLLNLLTHRYPRIRQVSAEKVYLVLLKKGTLVLLKKGTLVQGDKLEEKAFKILFKSWWEDVEEAKGKRLELCAMCNLDVGTLSQWWDIQ